MTSSSRGRFGVGERTDGERGDDSAAMLFATRGSAAGVTGVSFGVDFREKKCATDGRGLLLLAFLPLLEEEDEDAFFAAAGLAEVEAAAAEGFATGFFAGDATKDDTDSMGLLGVAAPPLDSFWRLGDVRPDAAAAGAAAGAGGDSRKSSESIEVNSGFFGAAVVMVAAAGSDDRCFFAGGGLVSSKSEISSISSPIAWALNRPLPELCSSSDSSFFFGEGANSDAGLEDTAAPEAAAGLGALIGLGLGFGLDDELELPAAAVSDVAFLLLPATPALADSSNKLASDFFNGDDLLPATGRGRASSSTISSLTPNDAPSVD
jgi:hypothetical protein